MKKRHIFYLITIFLLLLLFFAGLKTAAYFSPNKRRFGGNYLQLFNVKDDNLGYVPTRDTVIHSIRINDKDTVFDAYYHIGHDVRRLSTCIHDKKATKHLLFFGCSFTYGEGLNDTATFPYLADCIAKDYKVYNFGYSGYGPQEMLASMQRGLKEVGVTQDSGIVVYELLPAHVQRVTGTMFVHNLWGRYMPYYVMENNKPVRKGNFTTGRPLKACIYRLLGMTGLDVFFPEPTIQKKDIDLTVAIIAESKRLYLDSFPHSRFYVMLYPMGSMDNVTDQLKSALQADSINVRDYRPLFEMDSLHYIKGDGHPTALSNHIIVSRLAQDLGL